MKQILLITLSALFMLACRKEDFYKNSESTFIQNIKSSLKDSLSDNDFTNLDFSNYIITKPDSTRRLFRIAFKNDEISQDFVLLEATTVGKIVRGSIIHLKQMVATPAQKSTFNGEIVITFLNRKIKMSSPVINGLISNNHPINRSSPTLMVVPMLREELPDVIVTCYISSGGSDYAYSNYANLSSLLGSSNPGNSAYYSQTDGNGGGNYNTNNNNYSNQSYSSRSKSNRNTEDNPILVDFEPVENLSPIDITKYLKCFSDIPDNGSTCSIEIFTDIPVDSDPNKLFNWTTGSPGHTFLQIRKTLGNQTVMQNIGFYPLVGWKTLLSNAPVDGKFVDNSEHEYNAGLKMDLTPEQLKNTLIHISYLARFIKYDIDDYNCTDFALDVFNYSRATNPLQIPKYDIPGGMTPNGTNTPQGLYNQLLAMKNSSLERNNITIPGTKKWAAEGKGPCN